MLPGPGLVLVLVRGRRLVRVGSLVGWWSSYRLGYRECV